MDSDSVSRQAASPGNAPGVKMILGDRRWGDSVEKRAAMFASARRWTRGLTVAGIAALGWALGYPRPYGIMMVVLMLLPIVALLQIVRFKGLVRWDGGRHTPYPDVIVPCFIPVVALLVRDFRDVRPLEWLALIIPVVGLTLILMATLWVCARDVRAKSSRMAVAALFAFTYSVGAMIHVNAQYELSHGEGLFGRWSATSPAR